MQVVPASSPTWLAAVEALYDVVLHAEALSAGRERARAHLGCIAGHGVADRVAHLRVALDERRSEPGKEPHHVVEYQDLPVAIRAGADADRRDRDALGNELRERRRHELEHHAPAAGGFERRRV